MQMEVREIVVAKGGEGSRGGKIIGHTKSGKPIYGDKDYSHHQSQPGWSQQDHADLIKAHHDKAEEFRTKGSGASGKFAATMNDRANYHFLQARSAERASVGHLPSGDVSKGASGEGSRGGHIIGHTRSGKAIYNVSGLAPDGHHREWSKADHTDAERLHSMMGHDAKKSSNIDDVASHAYEEALHHTASRTNPWNKE